jgi:iron(III) transport system ATP-binding protein
MVTHDQEEALTMADRIVVMNQGVIEQIGTPEDIYRHPSTSFVADFIGTMNFVPGTAAGPNKVRCGANLLTCEADDLRDGEAVTFAVRPEDIVLQDVKDGIENVFTARIDALEFLGSFVRADLALDKQGEQILRADLSINLVRRLHISEGDERPVNIPKERIRIYPGTVSQN